MKGEILVRKRYLLIIALIISLLFGVYTFFSQKEQIQSANEIFRYCLYKAQSGFSVDYTKLDEKTKNFYYTKTVSNLHTALNILDLTSYTSNENSNQELINALNNLYFCMTVNDNNSRWRAVTEKQDDIQKYLHCISVNPNDKNNCKALFELTTNLNLNIENILINYKGTSPNWSVSYKIDGTEISHETYYTFKYTGKDGSLVKNVNYSIDSTNEGENGTCTLDNTKVYTGKLKFTAGLPKSTDRDITVKLEWNGKKESLILKKSK